MNLPIYRFLPYISPSTFIMWRKCQYKVYLTKLSGLPIPPQSTGKSAALGLFFDALIKEQIARQKQIRTPFTNFNQTVKQINIEEKEEIIKDAKELFKLYIDLGMLDRFLERGKSSIYLEQEKYLLLPVLDITGKIINIPILGRMDAIPDNKPFDWKTRGFYSVYTASPTKGYSYKIDSDKQEEYIDSLDNRDYCNIENVHYEWAIQLLFYNWLLGRGAKNSAYIIHEICKQKNKIVFTEFIGSISESFEKQILSEVREMWKMMYTETFDVNIPVPTPTKFICEEYNSLCQVAIHCNRYKETLGNPVMREHYL